jgi:hypothetical protein
MIPSASTTIVIVACVLVTTTLGSLWSDEPKTTEEVLRRWYAATGGPKWKHQHGWFEAFGGQTAAPAPESINTSAPSKEETSTLHSPTPRAIAPYSWCAWYGVRCAEPPRYADISLHRYITAIDLSDNGLVGDFPVALFCSRPGSRGSPFPKGFDQLTTLNVSHNQLTGSEPYFHSPGSWASSDNVSSSSSAATPRDFVCTEDTAPSLKTIEVIDISWNRVKSSLRYVLHAHRRIHGTGRRMPRLRWVSFRSNVFYDSIVPAALPPVAQSSSRGKSSDPTNFGSVVFPMLEYFDAGENHLLGDFPATSFAQHTPFLQVLKLDNNFFVNSALTWLSASVMGGVGGSHDVDDVDELRWHHTLTVLHLQYNYIQATIPNSVDRFTGLRELFLDGNRIYGTIPRELRSLRNLEMLSLAHNYLRGTLPCAKDLWFTELTPFSRLRLMDFTDNELEGSICAVAPRHRIEVLRFADNAFRGAVPPLEGGRLKEVTLGGENRWECDLPDPRNIPSWVDPAPSTKCVLDNTAGESSSNGIGALPVKRWGGGTDNSPSAIRSDATRRGSWWRNGLLGLLLPSSTSKRSDMIDAQPMGPLARHLFSVVLTLVVVVPLSVAFMKLAGVHLPQSPVFVPPGYRWFLSWIGYEAPVTTVTTGSPGFHEDDSDSEMCSDDSDDER